MGKYFKMSRHFDKQTPEEFGLVYFDKHSAIDPKDSSIWLSKSMFDYGWGKENGYVKTPIPDFEALYKIMLNGTNDEDIYGAASVLLELYPEELLVKCEEMTDNPALEDDLLRVDHIIELSTPVNRCSTIGKTITELYSDYQRWRKIASYISNIKRPDTSL